MNHLYAILSEQQLMLLPKLELESDPCSCTVVLDCCCDVCSRSGPMWLMQTGSCVAACRRVRSVVGVCMHADIHADVVWLCWCLQHYYTAVVQGLGLSCMCTLSHVAIDVACYVVQGRRRHPTCSWCWQQCRCYWAWRRPTSHVHIATGQGAGLPHMCTL
jgi:hypothetical protein